jgi:hypothetical protein
MACMHVLMNSCFAENLSMWFWLTPLFRDEGVTGAAHCGSFIGEGFGLLVVRYGWTRWIRRFMWFGSLKRNTLRSRENGVVLLKLCLTRVRLNLSFFDLCEVTSIRAFCSSRSDSYNESQGPTGGLRTSKTLCCRAPPARSCQWCLARRQ